MSSDEEDLAIGRMAREYQAAKRRLTALQGEASSIGKVMLGLGQSLTFAKPGAAGFTADRMEKLNAEKILSLVNEIETTWAEVETLREKLNGLGLTPN